MTSGSMLPSKEPDDREPDVPQTQAEKHTGSGPEKLPGASAAVWEGGPGHTAGSAALRETACAAIQRHLRINGHRWWQDSDKVAEPKGRDSV